MEQAVLSRMVSQPLLGLIYGTIHTQRISPSPLLYRVPTVLLNCYVTDRTLTSVIPAEERGGRTATEHLIRAGHYCIGDDRRRGPDGCLARPVHDTAGPASTNIPTTLNWFARNRSHQPDTSRIRTHGSPTHRQYSQRPMAPIRSAASTARKTPEDVW
jgi:hypothetical protein